ncbi:MAG: single-stranded-DNA-specific exonuclease RecJ [bacterium]
MAKQYDKEKEQILLKQGINRLLARLIAQRNIPLEKINAFLEPNHILIPHPYELQDMEKASKIFCDMALAKKKVAVIGDYDADGIISSTMIKELCKEFDLECFVFLPSRFEHGYGLSEKSLEGFSKFISQYYIPDLLFVLDCGSSNEKEIQQLKKMGISKIIIIDHHITNDDNISKSADALVNWHMSNHDEMCTCGEVYQFIRSLRIHTKKINPIEFLTYAALGTIGDVMPINGINRIIVKNGLTPYAIEHLSGHGLAALLTDSKINLNKVTQSDIAFKIVPKINAPGRMTDPYLAYYLFTEKEQTKTNQIVQQLSKLNKKRKVLQKQIEKEAMTIVKNNPDEYQHGALLFKPEWATGITGIVAAKISEKIHKPVIMAGQQNDQIKGSGRAPMGFDLEKILENCKDLFLQYGGHKLAAGVILNPKKIEIANKEFNKVCLEHAKQYVNDSNINQYDAELKCSTISLETAKMLIDNLYPYCNQFNEEPIFLISNVHITEAELFEPQGWKILKFTCKKYGDEIPFGFIMFTDKYGSEISGWNADIYFKFPQRDYFNNYGKYELMAMDIVNKNQNDL